MTGSFSMPVTGNAITTATIGETTVIETATEIETGTGIATIIDSLLN
jgi:hypothetical protein